MELILNEEGYYTILHYVIGCKELHIDGKIQLQLQIYNTLNKQTINYDAFLVIEDVSVTNENIETEPIVKDNRIYYKELVEKYTEYIINELSDEIKEELKNDI